MPHFPHPFAPIAIYTDFNINVATAHRSISGVSLKGATHEDAQYPAETAHSTEEMQIAFASALTAAALSPGSTGKFDYAWASFGDAIETGKFFNAKKK